MTSHDPLRVHRKVRRSSERKFGLIIAIAFAVLALSPLLHGAAVRWWALGVAVVSASAALIYPTLLGSLNRLWFALGNLMHAVVTPIVMGFLYFGAVVPVALLMRLSGKDPLRLKRTREASYWIPRDPPGPQAGTMSKQF
jgi:Saxitoxin biosynthesis operon protein SxtJ